MCDISRSISIRISHTVLITCTVACFTSIIQHQGSYNQIPKIRELSVNDIRYKGTRQTITFLDLAYKTNYFNYQTSITIVNCTINNQDYIFKFNFKSVYRTHQFNLIFAGYEPKLLTNLYQSNISSSFV